MKYIWAVLLLSLSTSALSGIGIVSENKGNACSIERNKKQMPGQKGADVESMDTYITQGCQSQITFKDDTKVKITENSRLLIDDFVYDPKNSDAGKLALKVGMGTVRYASGQITKTNPQQVSIKTPTATVAVRGTDFTMTVDETGQSLIVLVPSCKDDKDIKQYELQENICRVGTITVTTDAGTVILDQAFHATFVSSSSISPTQPTSLNTIEAKLNNNLILLRPPEITRAINEQRKSKREMDLEEEERLMFNKIQERIEEERSKLIADRISRMNYECNPSTNICVRWENDALDIQSRGKGTAYRYNEENIAEIKTEGYTSNTFITVVHNDASANIIIGDGSPSGNSVTIRQNSLAVRRPSK